MTKALPGCRTTPRGALFDRAGGDFYNWAFSGLCGESGGEGGVDYRNIVVARDGGVGIVALNRPGMLNAINRDLSLELDAAVGELEEDAEVRAIIVTGSGVRAFSAGREIQGNAGYGELSGSRPPDEEAERYVWHIALCQKPTIGAINGLAYGAGAVLASTFDIRVGCQDTSFRFLVGSPGSMSATWSLPLQVGWPVAKELLFTARIVQAREAHRIGLLNHLVASDQLMLKAIELARQIAANDAVAVREAKGLVLKGIGADWEGMYRKELAAKSGAPRATLALPRQ